MFDVAACQCVRAAKSPEVDIAALYALRTLLGSVLLDDRSVVRQAEHHSLFKVEGANAKHADAGESGPTEPVPITPNERALGEVAEGDPATKRSPTGTAIARTQKKPGPRRRQGGER